MKQKFSTHLAGFAVLLALAVVILGAYTRLTDAGLGCPDWPGCYGHLIVPQDTGQAIEHVKAWTEMVHRYAASTLGLVILILAGIAVYKRRSHPLILPLSLVGLVIFQGALGMWTVTWQLLPVVVMGHLLGGLTILSLLWWLFLRLRQAFPQALSKLELRYRSWAVLGLAIVAIQIALGGWVSANYAGLACVGFPACNGTLWPNLQLSEAFNLLAPIGVNYQDGVLDSAARITIQMVHRVGAIVTAVYIAGLAVLLLSKAKAPGLRSIAWLMFALVVVQFSLGIWNVLGFLPLIVAVAHNAVAALLLLTVVTLNYQLRVQTTQ